MKFLLVLVTIIFASNNALAQQATSNAPSDAYTATCQDVIDAKDEAVMSQSMISVRKMAFDTHAKHQAFVLYKALKDQGVANPLPVVLAQYETVFIPVRDGAGPMFDHIVSQNGSLKNAITKLCPEHKKDMFNFFADFYEIVLERYVEMQGK